MYFHSVVGTGSYTTSTTNMYNKDRFHVPAQDSQRVRKTNQAIFVVVHGMKQIGAGHSAPVQPIVQLLQMHSFRSRHGTVHGGNGGPTPGTPARKTSRDTSRNTSSTCAPIIMVKNNGQKLWSTITMVKNNGQK